MTAADQSNDRLETRWRAAVGKVLKGADVATLTARSDDGIAIGPLYPKAEVASPVRREAGRPFGIIQRADHPDRAVANRQALDDLGNGATGLVLVLSGAPLGRSFGAQAASPEDFEEILSGVELEAVSLRCEFSPDSGETARQALVALSERRKLAPALLDVDFGLDPLGAMARSGAMPAPWREIASAAAERVKSLREAGFGSPVMRADGRPHHEAGASEAQELAAVLATGVAYLRAMEAGGVTLPEARDAISFTLALDADLLLGLAKCRALRQLWAVVERACGLDPKPIRLHAETAWRMMTRRDPWTNMLRTTLACSAAILGGADSLGVLPFTSALGLPDAFARRIARNTPLVLLEEAHLGRVADPAFGSGAIEAMTEGLGQEAWRLFQDTERAGRLPGALIDGSWQAMLEASRARRQAEVAAGTRTIVGSNAFADPNETLPGVALPMPDRIAGPEPQGEVRFPPLPSLRDAQASEALGTTAPMSDDPGEAP